MRLTDRISLATHQAPVEQPGAFLGGGTVWKRKDEAADSSRELKIKVHNRLFETMDVSRMENLDPALISAKVITAIGETLDEDGRLLTDSDRVRLVDEVKNELLGLGPLEPLLRDDDVTDILVNGHDQVFVEKQGKLHQTGIHFHDDQHLMLIIDRFAGRAASRRVVADG
jgi:pilus assembly protein CpaF